MQKGFEKDINVIYLPIEYVAEVFEMALRDID